MVKNNVTEKQWDLTNDEIAELVVREEQKAGRIKLLEALQRQYGMEAKAEHAWWEAFILRHKIPIECRYRLIADHRVGKVWVKEEVKELDDRVVPQQDNPY